MSARDQEWRWSDENVANKEAEKRREEWQNAIDQIAEEYRAAAVANDAEKIQELQARSREVHNQRKEFTREDEGAGFVWLYLQQP